ncbi:PREDICTED: adhesion G-protein coupled receptor G4-like [Cyprinodon variegatus]|uniref:adhesion G-protein coupled receptor G4-like n=1 Tax=Cyprinodon variegatus TaxID=28743 RepID=UPI0007426EF6|nr:PREDICTED: adhesion G-protein coupled receptor G4-like [Cyprinodon variegatus]
MLLRSIRRMCDPLLERKWRWRLYFLQVIWLFLAAETSPTVSGYFLGDIKAVLNGCEDHWTLQGRTSIPQLSQMTVCVNIQVVVPGHWVAFSYSSVRTPNPNLGLEGDDKALYVWLLQVRHQFPFKISPMQWYKVCLRRDVQRNTFSVEVDYKIVAERTVIAQAIPPSGSLWLGCHQRRRTPEVAMGKVELYLFRMWADLGEHRSCEDGTVIGWNANHWEVTSPKAKETDSSLSCALKGGLGNVTGSSPGTPQVICDISQLCSNNSAYYWMSISVENETEFALNLVSKVFSCNRTSGETSTSNSNCINLFNDFPELELLQVEEVSCRENTTSNKRQTVCSVVLFLKHAISACDLQQYGEKALKSGSVQALITGNVERVGRNLCKDGLPPSDGFVKCMSNSSLDEICQSEERTKVKW